MGCGQSSASSLEPPTAVVPQEQQDAAKQQQQSAPGEQQQQHQSQQQTAQEQQEQSPKPAPTDPEAAKPANSAASTSIPDAAAKSGAAADSTLMQQLNEAAALEQQLRAMPTSSPTPGPSDAAASGDAGAAPAWKSFSPEKLAQIERDRAQARAKGPLVKEAKASYGLVCRACSKPNSEHVDFCTGCSFPAKPEDIVRLPDNIFLEMVQGKDIGCTVFYRDEDVLVFGDKFPVSENHLDIIPTAVYDDITVLTAEHIPMLERLYEVGRAELLSRDLPWLPRALAQLPPNDDGSAASIDALLTAGYNFPVSVRHLHLHLVLPPFKHEKVFQYPRWHSHAKVLRDLKEKGKVSLYSEQPDDAEGQREYERAMSNSKLCERVIAEMKAEEEKGKEKESKA